MYLTVIRFFHVLTLCVAAVTMEAPSGKVIAIIIACIFLVLLPHSEACSASKNDGKFSEFAQNNQKSWWAVGVISPRINSIKQVPFYSRK